MESGAGDPNTTPEAESPVTEGMADDGGGLGSVEEDASGRDASGVEWRFDAGELETVEGWLEEHFAVPGLVLGSGETKNLSDFYYDTESWIFYRSGYALRIRQRGKTAEATLQSLSRAAGGFEERREISESLDDGELATLKKSTGKVGERVRALAGGNELHRLFEVRTRRRSFPFRAVDSEGEPAGDALGEVSLDESEVPLEAGEEPARVLRVEVQAVEEAAEALQPIVRRLESELDLSPTPISKYQVGLYATGLVPEAGADLGPTDVDEDLSAGEVAYAILRRQYAALLEHEPGSRLGEDPEDLHDMRVASRRMRAAIKLFSEALPERALWFEGELRWLAGALGDVRDLDVQVDQLRAWSAADEEADAEAFESMVGVILEQRARARERMLDALDSSRYRRLVVSLAALLSRDPVRGPETGPQAAEPVTEYAPGVLSRRYSKFRKAAGRIAATSQPEPYHELRKKGKRLRYALEFLAEAYGKPVKKPIRPLKSLQDDLGRHQDAVVAADRLRELSTSAEHDLAQETIYAMGSYAERYQREAAELRAGLPGSKAFKRLTSREAQKDLEKSLEK
ncbi:MAG: CHAD domain-containing protein, partial [Rubrobacter sp.]|nr:CHAD domain-containing protein [Rubrobacter sp.]